MLCRSLHTRLTLLERKFYIPGGSFLIIGSSLLPIRFSRYTPIISICSTSSSSNVDMARNIFNNSCLTVSAKVLLKSRSGI